MAITNVKGYHPLELIIPNYSHREGLEYSLNLTPKEEDFLREHMKNFPSGYHSLTHNCVDPLESGLEALGYDLGLNVTPLGFLDTLTQAGIAQPKGVIEASDPKGQSNAPWAYLFWPR